MLRRTILAAAALAMVTILGAVSTLSLFTFVAVAGTTVFIMGGTGHSLAASADNTSYVQQYISSAIDHFVAPASTATGATGVPDGPYNGVAVITPEEDAPNYGTLLLRESVAQGLAALDSCVTSTVCDYNEDVGSLAPSSSDSFVIFGYSQSAAIAMLEKAKLAAEYAEGEGPDVTFVVIANSRPNGGLVARDTTGLVIALVLGRQRSELITEPVPTDTQYATVDIAIQYDGLADAPLNPLNLLAALNAYAGMVLLHPTYADRSLDEPGVVDQGQYGDTHYYLLPTEILPLLIPLQQIPLVGTALADALDPPLRVLVEAGYDRSISPGEPTAFDVTYFPDPVALVNDFAAAIPVGLDNGVEDLIGVRPFGTQRPGTYGVGAEVELVTTSESASDASTEADSGTALAENATEPDPDASLSITTDSTTTDSTTTDSITTDSITTDSETGKAPAKRSTDRYIARRSTSKPTTVDAEEAERAESESDENSPERPSTRSSRRSSQTDVETSESAG